MNKRFLKVAFLCLVACSVSASFTSCKDYDEDINSLRQETSGLSGQLSALEEALNSTKTDVQNAQKSADDAMAQAKAAAEAAKAAQATGDAAKAAAEAANAEALAAKALAEEAKAAAAKAKEEAIAEAIAQCKELMASTVSQDEFNQKVSELNGKIEGIQTGLSTLEGTVADIDEQVSDLAKWRSTVDTQLKALENLQSEVENLKTEIGDVASDLEALTSTVSGLSEDLNALKATVEGMNETIDGLKELIDSKATPADIDAAINELDTEIRKYVDGKFDAINVTLESLQDQLDALQSNINTVKDVLTFRLTSLSLMPTLYVDGIPTIEFKSLNYTPQVFSNGKLVDKKGASEVNVSNLSTVLKYHVSPNKITKDYIGKADFVSLVAETRAGEPVNNLISVSDFSIEDGVMTVTAKKETTSSLNLAGNKINTVALKATLAEKSLTESEKGQEISVFSEYTRLAETTVTPHIAAIDYSGNYDSYNHYVDSTTVYGYGANENVTRTVYYDGKLDLTTLVTGCYENQDGHHEISKDELKTYGIAYRFGIAAGAYELGDNNTNQQAFAKIDGHYLSSKLPNNESDNRAAIGKEPIVRAMLVDTVHNNLIDQKYFKLQFTEEEVVAEDINLGEIWVETATLGCDDIVFNFTWDQMTNLVYSKIGEKGMSKEDFHRLYTNFGYRGDGKVANKADDPNAGTYALTWTLTAEDLGKIVPETSRDYTVEIYYSDPSGIRGDVIFSAKATISIKDMPEVYGYYEQYWFNVGNIYRLTPVHYDPKGGDGQLCRYENNLLNGFNLKNGYLLTNLEGHDCRAWEMQFATKGQPAGFRAGIGGGAEYATSGDLGYKLLNVWNTAATLTYSDEHVVFADQKEDQVIFSIDKQYGKGLVGKDVKINIWAKLNDYNFMNVHSYVVRIVTPLTINAKIEGSFTDRVVSGSRISHDKAFTMTDFNNYIVAKTTTNFTDEKKKYAAELYKYYEVQEPVWNVNEARIGMKNSGGSIVVDDTLTYENSMKLADAYAGASVKVEGNELVFYNNSGSVVEKACNIFVPVTVTYGWGEQTEYVQIRLNPAE